MRKLPINSYLMGSLLMKSKKVNFIDLYSFLFDDKMPVDGSIFIGKSDGSILIGPSVGNDFCIECFRKRLLSSNFLNEMKYRKTLVFDIKKVHQLINRHKIKRLSFTMREYDLFGNESCAHHILIVPGCKHKYAE